MVFPSRSRGMKLGRFVSAGAPALRIASRKLVTCHETQALDSIIPTLVSRFRRIPVIGMEDGKFRGILTATDVLDYLGAGPRHWIFRKRKEKLKVHVKSIMETRVSALDRKHSVRKALETLQAGRRGAYPILYMGKPVGIISEWDFVRRIRFKTGIRVEELMVKPMIVRDNFSVLDAAKIMVRGRFRRLPVARDKILLGILTPSDILSYLRKNGLLSRLGSSRTGVTRVMRRSVRTIGPDADLYRAARIMAEKRVGGLPVVEDSELLGIITERDIVDALR